MRKNFFTGTVVNHWNCPETSWSQIQDVFKKRLDVALSAMVLVDTNVWSKVGLDELRDFFQP